MLSFAAIFVTTSAESLQVWTQYTPAHREAAGQECSAACSCADGNAQAARVRRSWRKTKRICCGGCSCASLGRKVAQGSGRASAQRRLERKKNSAEPHLGRGS